MQPCGATAIPGAVTSPQPEYYKISFGSPVTLDIKVNATNVTANSYLWVVLATGITANVGDTPIVYNGSSYCVEVINRTRNATIVYNHVDTTPLYLMILYFPGVNCSNTIVYDIFCSNPIVTYSYEQYYNDVIYPDIINKVTIAGVILGSVALVITFYLLKRRRKYPSSNLV